MTATISPTAGPEVGFRARPRAVRWCWLFDVRADVLLTFAWVPFWLVAHVFTGRTDAASGRVVAGILGGVFLVSLLHQPLTLLLVYGDGSQFRLRRRLFCVAPVVCAAAAFTAVNFGLQAVVIPVAAGWNTLHVLQQRYGLLRIHGRKAGYGSAQLDRAVVYVPFLAAVAVVAALPLTARQLAVLSTHLDAKTGGAVRGLVRWHTAAAYLAVPLGIAAVGVLIAYLRQERGALAGTGADAAKWTYLFGAFALLAALLVDPTAGLIAFIAGHALEYGVVVAKTMRTRYELGGNGTGLLPVVAGTAVRRWLLLGGFVAGFWIVDVQLRGILALDTYLELVYTVGLLHFVYDALIWRARRPAVAASFGVGTPTSPSVPA